MNNSGGETVIDLIQEVWGWSGIDPAEVVSVNAFGNLIVRDQGGAFWRICPEGVSCQVIADSADAYANLLEDEEFLCDWQMTPLVQEARIRIGPLREGESYCFKNLPVIGGEYGGENLSKISLRGLHAFWLIEDS